MVIEMHLSFSFFPLSHNELRKSDTDVCHRKAINWHTKLLKQRSSLETLKTCNESGKVALIIRKNQKQSLACFSLHRWKCFSFFLLRQKQNISQNDKRCQCNIHLNAWGALSWGLHWVFQFSLCFRFSLDFRVIDSISI